MIAWAGWSIGVAALLSLAALGAERSLGLYGRPRRWVWMAAMAGSLAAPLALVLVAPAPAPPETVAVLDEPLPIGEPAGPRVASAPAPSWSDRLDPVFPLAWAVASLALLGVLGTATTRLARARRRWPATEMAGVEVLETDGLGPAVIGFLRPRIAVPGWVRHLDARLQELIVRHEREHQRAGDSRLLAAGLVSRAILPWCLPLWWQFRRLRLAIELDCDRRVLAGGAAIADYGELLLEVGRRSAARPLPAVGIFERRSHLERRLRALMPVRPAYRLALSFVFGAVSVGAVLAGVAIPAPEPPLTWSSSGMEADTTRDLPTIVWVGPEHDDIRTVAELGQRVRGDDQDLSGYRIHARGVTRASSEGCGLEGTGETIRFWVDPGDPAGDIKAYCYLLVPLSWEAPEIHVSGARITGTREDERDRDESKEVRPGATESIPSDAVAPADTPRFETTEFDSRPRCIENCSAEAILAAYRRVDVPERCDVVVGIRIGVDGDVTATDRLKSQDGCYEPAESWARSTRWEPARVGGAPVAAWIAQPVRYYWDPPRGGGELHVEAETDPDAQAQTALRRAMVAQEIYRAEHDAYADAIQLDLSLPATVTIEVRGGGAGYVMVARHDDGTTAYCANSAEGRIVEGTGC